MTGVLRQHRCRERHFATFGAGLDWEGSSAAGQGRPSFIRGMDQQRGTLEALHMHVDIADHEAAAPLAAAADFDQTNGSCARSEGGIAAAVDACGAQSKENHDGTAETLAAKSRN